MIREIDTVYDTGRMIAIQLWLVICKGFLLLIERKKEISNFLLIVYIYLVVIYVEQTIYLL